jgi:translation initiation factor eIF-2B subunit delta
VIPRNVALLLEDMRNERIRGASYLARRGAEAYLLLAESLSGDDLRRALEEMRRLLPAVNPSMASLYNLSRFIPVTDDPELVKTRAQEFLFLLENASKEIGSVGSELINDGDRVITHSFSSAVLSILRHAYGAGKRFKVFLTESTPDYEGIALAQELEKVEIEFEVITDAQLGLFARRSTIALVGADTITRDGAVVNKAGTYLLALACHDSGVPFYASAESFKFHPELSSADVELLERPYSRQGYRVRNVLFDVTPWKYVRGIITELGVMVPPRDL